MFPFLGSADWDDGKVQEARQQVRTEFTELTPFGSGLAWLKEAALQQARS